MKLSISLPQDWRAHYERRPFLVEHNLACVQEFSLPALQQLACRLPPRKIEINAGDVPASLPGGQAADQGRNASQHIGEIASSKVWVGLLGLAEDAEYGAILDELLAPIGELLGDLDPGMSHINGGVLITSPRSTVPYHMDSEHSFLLQIAGQKEFVIFDKHDPELINEELVERFYSQPVRRMALPDRFLGKGRSILLRPGQGLHVPICAPHFVRTLDDVSVSLSTTYETPDSNRRAAVYRVNRRLRRLGLRPVPPGSIWDPVKVGTHGAWSNLKAAFSNRPV